MCARHHMRRNGLRGHAASNETRSVPTVRDKTARRVSWCRDTTMVCKPGAQPEGRRGAMPPQLASRRRAMCGVSMGSNANRALPPMSSAIAPAMPANGGGAKTLARRQDVKHPSSSVRQPNLPVSFGGGARAPKPLAHGKLAGAQSRRRWASVRAAFSGKDLASFPCGERCSHT